MAGRFTSPQGTSMILISVLMTVTSCIANQMDPHVYPESGPFFEGWYLRIVDHQQNVSLGFMYGRVLPCTSVSSDVENACLNPASPQLSPNLKHQNKNITEPAPLVFLGLLLSLETKGRLENPSGYFSPLDYKITKNGKPVEKNPDDKSPPCFEAKIAHNLTLVVNSTGTIFSIQLGQHILQGETTSPVLWGPDGEGPESYLEKLPLPFHWFVYSLRSTVKYYKYVNKETGTVISGGLKFGAVAHMEKNWGNGFPKAWVWAEGVDSMSKVSFAFSAGLVTFFGFDVKAQLSGYRNPGKQIICNFNPSNSFHSLHVDGCTGIVVLEVTSLNCAVRFEVLAPPESFSACLSAPMVDGFKKGCVESFAAVANITVFQRHYLSMVLTDNQILHLSALEFGKEYMCNGQCPVE